MQGRSGAGSRTTGASSPREAVTPSTPWSRVRGRTTLFRGRVRRATANQVWLAPGLRATRDWWGRTSPPHPHGLATRPCGAAWWRWVNVRGWCWRWSGIGARWLARAAADEPSGGSQLPALWPRWGGGYALPTTRCCKRWWRRGCACRWWGHRRIGVGALVNYALARRLVFASTRSHAQPCRASSPWRWPGWRGRRCVGLFMELLGRRCLLAQVLMPLLLLWHYAGNPVDLPPRPAHLRRADERTGSRRYAAASPRGRPPARAHHVDRRGGLDLLKEALTGVPPLIFIGLRFAIARLVLALFSLPQLRALDRRGLRNNLLISALFAGGMVLWILGLSHSNHLGETSFISSMGIVLVPVFAPVLRRPSPAGTWFALPLVLLAGFACLDSSTRRLRSKLGRWFFLGAALVFALMFQRSISHRAQRASARAQRGADARRRRAGAAGLADQRPGRRPGHAGARLAAREHAARHHAALSCSSSTARA